MTKTYDTTSEELRQTREVLKTAELNALQVQFFTAPNLAIADANSLDVALAFASLLIAVGRPWCCQRY